MAHFDLFRLHLQEGGLAQHRGQVTFYHLGEAAIAGHPDARYMLGMQEYANLRIERGIKHFIIAINLGDDESLEEC